jgi:prophage regulatory protein
MKRFLRRKEVEALTGLPCSTIYQLMDEGQFPRPIRVTRRIVAWVDTEIDEWQDARIAESRPESTDNS